MAKTDWMNMENRLIWTRAVLLAACLVLVSACQPTSGLPTQAVIAASSTPGAGRATLPPSWTPGPSPTNAPQASATSGAIPTTGLNTLPPSWTPFVEPTLTRIVPVLTGTNTEEPTITPAFAFTTTPTPFLDPPTANPDATLNADCAALAVDKQKTDTAVNPSLDSVHVAWIAVKGAEGYHVWVRLADATEYLFNASVTDTSIAIPSRMFPLKGTYGWEVMPLFHGDRMCPSLTGHIVAQ